MAKEGIIGTVLALVLIIGGGLALWGYNSIPDALDDMSKDESLPFTIAISPQYFDEGNFDYNDHIPFTIQVDKITSRNITYLELFKDSFKVSRKDGGLDKPTSQVNWKNSQTSILLYGSLNPSYASYSYFPLKAEGEMATCKNCFIGDEYPYVFTFTIYYKENNEELKSKQFEEIIPIK